ncbi:MAG TPA: SHOCT domain-containing protein [Acidimicrobiales bacterium]|nr:SHOCT domain-containing protein [Acidimicrobiales bacterium]
MPRLLRGVARTAVVAGTATAVSNRVSRRQANRGASDDQQAPAPQQDQQAAASPPPDPVAQLKALGELHAQGVLTDEELAAQKAKILSA